MKRLILSAIFLTICNILFAQVNPDHILVDGYTRSDGSFVSGHYKTMANTTVDDNFSTIGNINPYTGEPGWKPRDSKLIYDSYYNYKIPSHYIYKSKVEYQLSLVNSLNMLTNSLDEHLPSEMDRPNWILNNTTLDTRLQMNVWEADEEYFAKSFLTIYFKEVEAVIKTKGILDLLMKVGFTQINVKTPNHTLVVNLNDLK